MVDDGVRVVRLAAFAVAATVLALAAHVLAGGRPPALLPTLAAIVLPGGAALALSRRRRRLVEITVTLGAVQLMLHEVFSAGPADPAGTGSAGIGHLGHVGMTPNAWMPVTHAGAVLLTALLLAHGEHVLHLLQTWWHAVPAACRAVPVAVVVRPRCRPVPVTGGPRPVLISRWACAPVVRRGPPVPVC
jgi:hypothetical protein